MTNKLIVVQHDQVYYYQDVKCRDEMYDKDILMLQVGDIQRMFLMFSPFTFLCIHNVVTHDPPYKLFTDSCFQNGPQPLPHIDLVEI